MKKAIGLFLSLFLMVGLLAACGTSNHAAKRASNKKNVLIMGTSADYPPFEYVKTEKSNNIIGFDVDLANALAKKLGYKIQVKDIDFSGLIQSLKSGEVDLVLAGMTPTPQRKKNVDFSDIYYTAKYEIISKKGSGINTLNDLKGKTVGVQLGSIQETKAKEINKTIPINIQSRDRIPDMIEELKSGRFDAAIIENTVAKGFLAKESNLTGFEISDKADVAGSAIAFPKNSDLTTKFNNELRKMKKDGELNALIVKWFGGTVQP